MRLHLAPIPGFRVLLALALLCLSGGVGRAALLVGNTHGIEGYADHVSIAPGEALALKVHTIQPTFSIEFLRFGSVRETMSRIKGIPGRRQDYPDDAAKVGAGWQTDYVQIIPPGWRSGLYAARLYDDSGQDFYITFIVREGILGTTARLAVLSSTNTWQAYNDWGRASLYYYGLSDGGQVTLSNGDRVSPLVSLERPNPGATPLGNTGHLAQAEKHILSWLETQGYPYSQLSDWDLHNAPSILFSFDAVIISTHSEYWSKQMYDALVAYLNQGGKLVYLAGNSIYWKVTVEGTQIECRKDGSQHTQASHRGEPGGLWRNVGRPEASVLGVAYTDRYRNYAPYRVLRPDHWALAGTGLPLGGLMGSFGLNLASDRGGMPSQGQASGYEMDSVIAGISPANLVVVATGNNPGGGADMTYYDHPGGGGVFAVGSISFGGSLIVDEKLSQTVSNVLERFGIHKSQSGSDAGGSANLDAGVPSMPSTGGGPLAHADPMVLNWGCEIGHSSGVPLFVLFVFAGLILRRSIRPRSR